MEELQQQPGTASHTGEDLLETAFQLAHFIVQDRSAALAIVDRARSKLTAQRSRERKRIYWRNRGLKQKIRRMTRAGQDALQWLIYLESECYERQHEQRESPSKRLLGVRFIKSIVQMTSNMSCFYVAVGLHRILHNYNTPDIQNAYESLTKDFVGTEKYRRVKRALMQKLARRFGGLITIGQADNQELRFEVDENRQAWLDVTTECLEMFTPWSTRHGCCPPAGPTTAREQSVLAKGGRNVRASADREEMEKCHLFIHPPCFDKLTAELGLDSRPTRLAMPRFNTDGDRRGRNDQSADSMSAAPPLTAAERAVLTRPPTADRRLSRQKLPPELIVLADGVPCAQLELTHETFTRWKIEEGTTLIEFCTQQAGEPRVWALHWIDYTNADGIAAGEHTIPVGGGAELILKTIPVDDESEGAGDATMLLMIGAASRWIRWKKALQSLFWPPDVPSYALAALLALLGLSWPVSRYHDIIARQRTALEKMRLDRASDEAALAALKRQLAPARPAGETAPSYRLLPDSLSVRGPGSAQPPVIVLLPNTALVELELPIPDNGSDNSATQYRATLRLFADKSEVLRESLLKPRHTAEGWAVVFVLPAAMVDKQDRYVISLESITAGAPRRAGDFSFYLRK
jgi:hypothetical protein